MFDRDEELFSVAVEHYPPDVAYAWWEYVRKYVNVHEAWRTFEHYTHCPSAHVGWIKTVRITSVLDETAAEWRRDLGLTFPPHELEGNSRRGFMPAITSRGRRSIP